VLSALVIAVVAAIRAWPRLQQLSERGGRIIARAQGVDFNRPGAVQILDNALSLLGMREENESDLKPSRKALSIIREFEGYERVRVDGRLDAYPDPATGGAPWTIGWVSTGADIRKGTVWAQEQAYDGLREQVDQLGKGVSGPLAAPPHDAEPIRYAGELRLQFWGWAIWVQALFCGGTGDAHARAALEFARWNKADARVLSGLTRRRSAEAKLCRGEA
jgi:lysozyme